MRKLIALLLILSTSPAFAAFGAASAWDVRTTGSNTNGGAFDSGVGSPGTDESQGTSGTAITVTLTGTTTGTGSPAFTSTTHGPGNFVHIASGSGCSTGWFEVLSQAAGVATFDHAMGVATNVCVGTIGGSLLTIAQANTNSVSSNTIWIQSGTYTLTSTVAIALATVVFNGYGSTHGDNGTKPLITTATNSTDLFTASSGTVGAISFVNLSLSNTAGTRGNGVVAVGAHATNSVWVINNDIFDGFLNALNSDNVGAHFTVGNVAILKTEIKNSTGSGAVLVAGGLLLGLTIDGSYIHNNASLGVNLNGGAGTPAVLITRSIFAANAGTPGSNGAFNTDTCASIYISNSTFANNTQDGFHGSTCSSIYSPVIVNSIFYGNTGWGVYTNSSTPNSFWLASHNNGYGSNTLGNNAAQFVLGPSDITGITNPFTNSGSGDYSLNSTAGAGALLKGAGYPGIFPGGTSTGSIDIGAVQTGGGGTSAGGNFGVSN